MTEKKFQKQKDQIQQSNEIPEGSQGSEEFEEPSEENMGESNDDKKPWVPLRIYKFGDR